MAVLATLCYLIKDGKVLLLEKRKGFGAGKTNAPGGKLRKRETPKECVVREVFEETGLRVSGLKYHGALNFFFGQRSKPNMIVHVFSTESFNGEIRESDAGSLKWYDLDKIPYEKMWEDDRHWLPLLLEGKKFLAWFYYDKNVEKLFDWAIKIENQTS